VADFVHRERIRFGDLDAFGHVNNVLYLRYFETAWIAYRVELGLYDPSSDAGGGLIEGDTGFGPILAEAHLSFRSPAQFNEELEVALTVSDMRRSSWRVDFEMSVGDRLCTEGHMVYVGYDYTEQRATPIPDRWRELLERRAVAGEDEVS
jgi:acyl-CoA thioester hydrolase